MKTTNLNPFTELEKEEEMRRREKNVGTVGFLTHPDGSKTRVQVVADHGPVLEVVTLDESENYNYTVLHNIFTPSSL